MIIRGQVITGDLVEIAGRGGGLTFMAPDANKYASVLPLSNPGQLRDLYDLSFEQILDYLEELGRNLHIGANPYLQQACELSYRTAPTTPTLIDFTYERIPLSFTRDRLREVAEHSVGVGYLEGWVSAELLSGARVEIRCFGSRAVHIVAGNSPIISVMTIIRNALLRSDAIIKAPSNDPFTALAVAQTMCEMAPDHPITKHLTVAYWKGGDVGFEERLYRPHNIEKIVAWGGFASVKHVTRYIQPGLELISLDPKRSASIIGSEAFGSEATMQEVAVRLATDIGAVNQAGCVNARVIYVLTGTDNAGIEKATTFGQHVYDAMMSLPTCVSTKPKSYDRSLKESVDAIRLDGDWFDVIGGRDDEGAIIVSRLPEPVSFAPTLNDRTANIVPVDSINEVVGAVNSWTQTVGIYPESLKDELKDILPLYGAQRLVSLGYAAASAGSNIGRQDAIEPMRRMGKWIVNEISTPDRVPPLWTL
jgi:hypothetical protein